MTTPKSSKQSIAVGGTTAGALPPSRLPLGLEERFNPQPVAIQTNFLYDKPTATTADALVRAVPRLMDNPLYEGGGRLPREAAGHFPIATNRHGNGFLVKSSASQVFDHQVKKPMKQQKSPLRSSLARLSLDKVQCSGGPIRIPKAQPTRRIQSVSLKSWDYGGMWETVEENVLRTNNRQESISVLEDFRQFREQLADLKKNANNEGCEGESVAPPPTPAVLTPSSSVRSPLNYHPGCRSNRSLNNVSSPSRRPTSPLQRLPGITSRKGVSGLDPHLQQELLPPRLHRLALTMRAGDQFKFRDQASMNPLLTGYCLNSRIPPMPVDFFMNDDTYSSTGPVSKRFFNLGCSSAEAKKSPGNDNRKGKDADAGNDGYSNMGTCSPRTIPKRSQASSSGEGQTGRSTIANLIRNDLESLMSPCSPRSLEGLNTISPAATPRNSPQQQQASKKKAQKVAGFSSCSPRARVLKAKCIYIPGTLCYSAHILE